MKSPFKAWVLAEPEESFDDVIQHPVLRLLDGLTGLIRRHFFRMLAGALIMLLFALTLASGLLDGLLIGMSL